MSHPLSSDELARMPFRPVDLPRVNVALDRREDDSLLLYSREPRPLYDPTVIRRFMANAAAAPDRNFLAERPPGGGDWQRIDFATAAARVRAIGEWLLSRGMGQDSPLMLLSGNSIHHAILRLGAMAAGVPVCPVSINYAYIGGDFARLRHVVDLVRPAILYVEGGDELAPALAALPQSLQILTPEPDRLPATAIGLAEVLATEPGAAITHALTHPDPDTHVAYMLTSGSTGRPKAVIHTQRMQASNLHLAHNVLGRALGWDEVMLDWLPWSHVAGTSNLLAAAVFGGTLHIDAGKPMPGLFDATLRNLAEVPVSYFANVPAGFAMLTDALESDPALCETFFSKLRLVLYGGAALPQSLQDRLQTLAVRHTGHRIAFTTGYGSTETCSGILVIYYLTEKVGIGLPPPGAEVKLVPLGDRYELRMRGDFLTPGYLHNAEKTAEMFDDEGFYCTGDTARFHDEDDPAQGLTFAGRLAEEFKLGTGTWVSGGELRGRLVEALAPAITDLILCGEGRDALAVLGVPSEPGLRRLADDADADLVSLCQHPRVREHVRERLAAHNAANPGQSTRIRRFAFLQEGLSANRHELSDKGSVNQAMALANHAGELEALYARPAPGQVIRIDSN